MAVRRLGHEVGEPTVVDRLAQADELHVTRRLDLAEAPGHERNRLKVHRAVEQHTRGDAIMVVVGEPRGGVMVPRGAEVRVIEVATALEHRDRGFAFRRRLRREAIEVVEASGGAVGPQVLDEAGADVRVVGDDDDRIRTAVGHGMTIGMCCQPRTVDVGASSMPS